MSDGVNADFRDMIMEILTPLKNTIEGALAGASNPSKNLL